MNKRQIPATHVRDSILNVMMGFAGKDNFVTIPLTFARFCDGDLIIAALFSQILYWTGVTDDPEGWIAKSYEDWHEELSLTRSQVDRSVKALEKIGLQTDKRRSRYHDFAPTIHYRFDKEILSAAANAFFADPVNGTQKMKGKHVSNLPSIKQKHLLNISKSESLNINESEMLENNESYRETMEESIEENITTFVPATQTRAVSLSDQIDTDPIANEADDEQFFPLKGKNSPAKTIEKPSRTKTKDKTTPPAPSLPAPKRSEKQTANDALVTALGDAWGAAASNGDYALYLKKAQKLALDMPPEKFKAFCDYRKKQAGDFASKLSIATITENGWVSKFLEYDAKQKYHEEYERQFFIRHPEYIPTVVTDENRARPEQVQALLDAIAANEKEMSS